MTQATKRSDGTLQPGTVRVAAAQFFSGTDVAANLELVARLHA